MLPAGPADSLQPLRYRLGNRDGTVHRHDQPGEPGQGGRPGVGRENHRLGLDPGPGAQQLCRLAGNDLADATALVDFHAEGQRHAAHALHQQGWLHGGIAALEDPGEMHRRTGPACHFAGVEAFEGTDAEPFAGGEGIVPGVEVVRRGGGPQPALLLEVRIDVMPCSELPSSWIARSALSPRKRACASLQKPSKVPIFGHQDITKPPFLPERRRRRRPAPAGGPVRPVPVA